MKNLIFASFFAFALLGVITTVHGATYHYYERDFSDYSGNYYYHSAPKSTYNYNNSLNTYNNVNPYVATSADRNSTNNTSTTKSNSTSSTSTKTTTSKSVSSSDSVKDKSLDEDISNSNDPFDSDSLTALSLRGSGGFMPSSIWQWLFVIILITAIIILARLIGHTYTKNNHVSAH